MLFLIIFIAIFLIINWTRPFYSDRNKEILVSDESKCFSEDAKSIIYNKNRAEAVLLIHGFPTTPKMYTYAAKRLDEAGYDAYAPLIPTFGSNIKDFEKTNYTQWFNFICSYYEELRKKYKKLYVLGISMGGAMTLDIGEKYSNTPLSPDRIIAISSPVAYNNIRFGIYTNLSAMLAPTAALFIKNINARIVYSRPESNDGNEDWNGYGGTFIKQGLSLAAAFDRIRHNLKRIAVPMYVMHDKNDKTVPFKNLAVIEKYCHDYIYVKREVEMKGDFKHSHHSLLMYHSVQKEYMDDIISFLRGSYDRKEK